MPPAEEETKKDPEARRTSVGLLEQKTRSRSGNTRIKQINNIVGVESSSESQQLPGPQIGKDLFKALKNLKIRQLELNNHTRVEESNNTMIHNSDNINHGDNTVAEIEAPV